jgi:coenzyme Q-binding protein COQ10
MYKYNDVKEMDFSATSIYNLVKDIEKYPEFLPWCNAVRITSVQGNEILADMVVGFSGITEKYTSRVNFDDKNKKIFVQYEHGPFKYLENQWFFESIGDKTKVHFNIEFEFKSKILDVVLSPIFETVIKRMISAFEERAQELYG